MSRGRGAAMPSAITGESGSFRDPAGQVYYRAGKVLRTVMPRAAEDFKFVRDTGLLDELVEQGRLVPYALTDRDALPPLGARSLPMTYEPERGCGSKNGNQAARAPSHPNVPGPHHSLRFMTGLERIFFAASKSCGRLPRHRPARLARSGISRTFGPENLPGRAEGPRVSSIQTGQCRGRIGPSSRGWQRRRS